MGRRKSRALVLRVRDYSETSQVVTALSRDYGRFTALAKGSRRKSNSFGGPFDLLQEMEILWIHKESGAMGILTEAQLLEPFAGLRKDYGRFYAAAYLADLTRGFTVEDQASRQLYDLLRESLLSLTDSEDALMPLFRAEIRMLKMLGFIPRLDACCTCSGELPGSGRIAFSPHAGGAACARCRISDQARIGVQADAVRKLERLSRKNLPETEFNNEIAGEMRRLLDTTVSYHLEYQPRSRRSLDLLRVSSREQNT